jgi:hypothetical protein
MICCVSGCEVTTLHPKYKFCTRHWKEYGHFIKDKRAPLWLKFLVADTGRVERAKARACLREVPFDLVYPDGDKEDFTE